MVNVNQDKNQIEETKLSPLGTDEINSVIKSYKNSTFNQEELYKKDEKNFVKKTLFDLAKESERISSEENQSETDNSSEENVGINEEIIKDINQNDKPDNINSISESLISALNVKGNLSNIHENQRLIIEKYNWEKKEKDYLTLFKS